VVAPAVGLIMREHAESLTHYGSSDLLDGAICLLGIFIIACWPRRLLSGISGLLCHPVRQEPGGAAERRSQGHGIRCTDSRGGPAL
jgi:hypothetical protein